MACTWGESMRGILTVAPIQGSHVSASVMTSHDQSTVETIVDALAVTRLTRLFQEDDVWPILEIRKAYLAKAGDSRWTDLAECPFCLGVWMAAGVVAARYLWPRGWPVVARILAGSAVAGHLGQLG